ncbi:bifunctional 4-hydroxy-2-oxoglutarate aldolase/2-dehydro-3-deoxy-phosphogluconate aldolase [Govanella unica]|uniref:2-dehydro-3-deoxy-phosphogluconate aldolase n=1 Tax=Govanella unica TaxID=2975056 RepID=A0A9X3TVX8_9PROT|nr:bifunctional 4-hydroxy-2-oxoglutarate aldolase/2-dehydro-3-deoxy-phosphogluconate aldolase [Govania unica]MDA5192689.1 bifunctional 4-hydroxy-2-oxoglutarate aldolase/2-dehydro-3-deoxy-phosphogluconate aldolase [Govania unica]
MTKLSLTDLEATLGSYGILPVVAISDDSQAVPLGEAVQAGGLPLLEVTFRTAAAARSIERLRLSVPDLLVGAGTILTVEQAKTAISAGAQFLVSPGFNIRTVLYAREHGIPFIPGVLTPTDIEEAISHDVTFVKLFPAGAIGGADYLKAVSAPYGMMRFMPTGGISPQNLRNFLDLRSVVACGGSWIAPTDWIDAGRYDDIRATAAAAVALVKGDAI